MILKDGGALGENLFILLSQNKIYTMIKLPRFYRYIIYKLYIWSKKDDTPVVNVIGTLTLVHAFQLLTLYIILLFLGKLFFPKATNVISSISNHFFGDKRILGLYVVLLMVLHYFLLYNKKRWEEYIEEFKEENPTEKRKGSILVIAYLVGSIVLCFVITIVLFDFLRFMIE